MGKENITNLERIKFIDNEFSLDVKFDYKNITVWLNQEEMAELFDIDRTRIVRHISNIYKEKELDESTCAENAQVQKEGNRKESLVINNKIWHIKNYIKCQFGIL